MKISINDDLEEIRRYYLKECEFSVEEIKNNFKPGSLGFHEAFHTISVIMDAFDSYVVSHPVILSNPEYFKDAVEIVGKMYDLYNKLGNQEN